MDLLSDNQLSFTEKALGGYRSKLPTDYQAGHDDQKLSAEKPAIVDSRPAEKGKFNDLTGTGDISAERLNKISRLLAEIKNKIFPNDWRELVHQFWSETVVKTAKAKNVSGEVIFSEESKQPSQDFKFGALAINTNKDRYLPGEASIR